jgi:hypothetical protein
MEFREIKGNNELVEMTRRYPKLSQKVLYRDSIISRKIVQAWDIEQDKEKVLSTFLKEHKNLSDERYWEIMRSVWVIAGSIENVPLFRELMMSQRKEKYNFSTPEEQKSLRELPDSFEVYRACNIPIQRALSWTLSKEYAEWYKEKYNKDKVFQRTVKKTEVFALIERNKESEIIIL